MKAAYIHNLKQPPNAASFNLHDAYECIVLVHMNCTVHIHMLSCLHTIIQFTITQPIQPNHMPAFLIYCLFFFLSLPLFIPHLVINQRQKKNVFYAIENFFTMPSPNDQAGRIHRQAFMVELSLLRTSTHLGTSPYLLCARCQPLFSLPFAY